MMCSRDWNSDVDHHARGYVHDLDHVRGPSRGLVQYCDCDLGLDPGRLLWGVAIWDEAVIALKTIFCLLELQSLEVVLLLADLSERPDEKLLAESQIFSP